MKELTTKLQDNAPNQQYQCIECGLHYEDKETAKKCEAWCSQNKSCNLEIIKNSTESKQQK